MQDLCATTKPVRRRTGSVIFMPTSKNNKPLNICPKCDRIARTETTIYAQDQADAD